MTNQSLLTRVLKAIESQASPELAADCAIAEVSKAFRDAELGLSADWLDKHRRKDPPALWRLMEIAFDSVIDDCFYEFHHASEAMLRVIAERLVEQGHLEAASYLRGEALRAAKDTEDPEG